MTEAEKIRYKDAKQFAQYIDKNGEVHTWAHTGEYRWERCCLVMQYEGAEWAKDLNGHWYMSYKEAYLVPTYDAMNVITLTPGRGITLWSNTRIINSMVTYGQRQRCKELLTEDAYNMACVTAIMVTAISKYMGFAPRLTEDEAYDIAQVEFKSSF